MNVRQRENEIKLDILASLARSQHALASMAEHIAAQTACTELSGEQIIRQMEALSRYQRMLAEKITGIRLRRLIEGKPGKPWLKQCASISKK